MLVAIGILGVVIGIGLGYRGWRRAAIRRALRIEGPEGIAEESFHRIGGIEQWVQIRGERRDDPVLLVLHGGPGWPNSVFTPRLRAWERHFTVVQWDQRGAGKTWGRNGRAGSGELTFERRVLDAIELVELLRIRLSVDKVVLLGESMGTLVGIPLVHRRPDLFSAYVATDLYVEMRRNEARKRELTIARLQAAGKAGAVAALARLDPDPARWTLRDWSTNMGWAFRTNLPRAGLERSLLLPSLLLSPSHSLRDVGHVLAGFQHCTARMLPEILAFDARRYGTRFEVPFFLIQGAEDVVTLTELAVAFHEEIEAATKGVALIPDAGHFAMFTQPARFLEHLRAVVLPVVRAGARSGAAVGSG